MDKQLVEYFKREADKFVARQEELSVKDLRGELNHFDGFHSLIEADIKAGLITDGDLC